MPMDKTVSCKPQVFGNAAASLGTVTTFSAPQGQDTMVKQGVVQEVNTYYQCITVMEEYESNSLEELRMEDYAENRKCKQSRSASPCGLFAVTSATQSTVVRGNAFGLQNKPSGFSTTCFGTGTTGFGTPAPAIGTGTTSFGTSTTGFGTVSMGFGTGTPSFGTRTTAIGTGTTGFGATAGTTGFGATSGPTGFGTGTAGTIGFGTESTGFGIGTTILGTASTGFGAGATGFSGTTGFGGICSVQQQQQGFGTGTTGFGTPAPAFGSGTTSFGTGTTGFGTVSTGVGTGTPSFGTGTTAIGTGTTGSGATADTTGFGATSGSTGFSIGTAGTIGLGTGSTGFGTGTTVLGTASTGFGAGATGFGGTTGFGGICSVQKQQQGSAFGKPINTVDSDDSSLCGKLSRTTASASSIDDPSFCARRCTPTATTTTEPSLFGTASTTLSTTESASIIDSSLFSKDSRTILKGCLTAGPSCIARPSALTAAITTSLFGKPSTTTAATDAGSSLFGTTSTTEVSSSAGSHFFCAPTTATSAGSSGSSLFGAGTTASTAFVCSFGKSTTTAASTTWSTSFGKSSTTAASVFGLSSPSRPSATATNIPSLFGKLSLTTSASTTSSYMTGTSSNVIAASFSGSFTFVTSTTAASVGASRSPLFGASTSATAESSTVPPLLSRQATATKANVAVSSVFGATTTTTDASSAVFSIYDTPTSTTPEGSSVTPAATTTANIVGYPFGTQINTTATDLFSFKTDVTTNATPGVGDKASNNTEKSDMSANRVPLSVIDELTCWKCRNMVQNPVTLDCCKSSFCRECLVTEAKLLHCPLCEEAVDIPAAELKSNIVLDNIVKAFRKQVHQHLEVNNGITCHICEKVLERSSCSRCDICKITYCPTCLKICHPAKGVLSRHSVYYLSESTNDARVLAECIRHNKDCVYFCLECNAGLCLDCYDVEHGDHSVEPLFKAFKAAQRKVDEVKETANQLRQNISALLERHNQHLILMKDRQKQRLDTIEGYFQSLRQALDLKEKRLIDREKKKVGRPITEYEMAIKEAESRVTCMDSLLSLADVMKGDSRLPVLMSYRALVDGLHKCESQLTETDHDSLPPLPSVMDNVDAKDVRNIINFLDNGQKDFETHDNNEGCSNGGDGESCYLQFFPKKKKGRMRRSKTAAGKLCVEPQMQDNGVRGMKN